MIRYASAIAFFAMLAYSCASKKQGEDTIVATGGGGFEFTGGRSATGGAASGVGGGGGAGSIDTVTGLADITQAQLDELTNGACVGWSSEGENVPALIQFVVDTSGSMRDTAANTNNASKWSITAAALQDAIDSLPRMTDVGMLLWPNMNTVPNNNDQTGDVLPVETCVNTAAMIPIAPLDALGSSHRTALAGALSAATPAGGTPMADAYAYAFEHGILDPNAVNLPGARYMVLITDGQPTIQLGCAGTGSELHPVAFQPVLDLVTAAEQQGVKTFVIGSPGSEAQSSTGADGRGLLSAAARAGDTGPSGCSDTGPNYCHFDMTTVTNFATGFADALANITGQVLTCDFKITNIPSGTVINNSKLNVVYQINGSSAVGDIKLVLPSADSTCPDKNGWYLDPNDSTHVILCANTCDMIHKDAGAVLKFTGGCDPILIVT